MKVIRKSRIVLAALALTAAAVAGRAMRLNAAGTPPDAMAQMKALTNQVLQILKDPVCKSGSDPQACRQKLREQVETYWDLNEMARSALGTHWKELGDEERQRFARLFGQMMEAIYISRANLSKARDASGTVQVDFVKEIDEGDGYSQVNTNVTLEGHDEPVSVNYMLRFEGDRWKVYDIVVANVSLIGNYRNQFNRVINNKGYPELVREMEQKVQQLNASEVNSSQGS